jgi:hypothetical protein
VGWSNWYAQPQNIEHLGSSWSTVRRASAVMMVERRQPPDGAGRDLGGEGAIARVGQGGTRLLDGGGKIRAPRRHRPEILWRRRGGCDHGAREAVAGRKVA